MRFDGRTFAKRRRERLLKKREAFGPLTLGIVAASGDPVTDQYVRIKEATAQALNIDQKRYPLPAGATTDDAVALVHTAAGECDGVLVQLPLPESIDGDALLAAIPPEKDVDGLSPAPQVLPPVVAAIDAIIESEAFDVTNKDVVVIGRGRLVGAPAAAYFEKHNSRVHVFGKGDHIEAHTRRADILVLGAGSPGLITRDMVKEGALVFDAGTSESGGTIVGDADPSIADKVKFFTPVPGGIGPVAIIEIFSNLLILNEK